MTKESNFYEIALNIEKSLETEGFSSSVSQIQNTGEFHKKVEELIRLMMESNFERFLTVMYRMDISEQKLKIALDTPDPQNVYMEIANLVIEREKQKIKWREKYKP
jgi:hypothetical protein